MELRDVNLLADSWAQGVPHEMLELLRREAPVFWHPQPPEDGPGFWAVTRYDDVREVSRDVATYSSETGGTFIPDQTDEALAMMRLTLLNMDPPKHHRYRRLVNRGFTPRMIATFHDQIAARAASIVDAVCEQGECDFVSAVASEMPAQVICDMIGVPEEDRRQIVEWTNTMVGFDDPDFQQTQADGEAAAAQIYAYCDQIAEDRKREPRDDIMTALVNAEVDGDRLDKDELNMFFVLLAVAGNETTRNLLAHSLLAAVEHPDEKRRLLAEPELFASGTEEFLRWGSSITNFRRTVTRDTVLHGQELSAGDKVVVYYISANRDEDVFADPYRFDVARSPNEHLTFGGGGEHFCLGANLARLEIRMMMQEVLTRLPDIELAGPYRRLRSDFINGIKEMPVRFTPTTTAASA